MRVYLVHPWQMCIVACVQRSGICPDKNRIDARLRCRGEGGAICVAIYNPVKCKLYVYKHVKQMCVTHKCSFLFISSLDGRGNDSKHNTPASNTSIKYSVYTCCVICFQSQWMYDEMLMLAV